MKWPIKIVIRPIFLFDVRPLKLTPWQKVKLGGLLASGAVSAILANNWYQIYQNEPTIDLPLTATIIGIVVGVALNWSNIFIAWSEKMEKMPPQTPEEIQNDKSTEPSTYAGTDTPIKP